jgi:hypothetical protein
MFHYGRQSGISQWAYGSSPRNTARAHHRPVRDDGHHTRPVRREINWRRRLALTVAALACAIAALVMVRAVTNSDIDATETTSSAIALAPLAR